MKHAEFLSLLDRGKRRYHLLGTDTAGVVAGLDLEGRLFAVLNGEVLNRVNPEACLNTSTKGKYLNPGGDGLWPAPEGSCLGYEYATGAWRVPPGLSGARYWVVESTPTSATMRAEIDLINGSGRGVPTAFERRIRLAKRQNAVVLTVTECIEYLGPEAVSRAECLLAPWTLCQFDCGDGCGVFFPKIEARRVRDLYEPSDDQRALHGDRWFTRTDCGKRYQISLPQTVEWIEYVDPRNDLRVRRTAELPPRGMAYVDIADQPTDRTPDGAGTRFSVYSDLGGFMEIEAAGGCPKRLASGQVLSLTVTTEYRRGTKRPRTSA
jgi:hypothetical protein